MGHSTFELEDKRMIVVTFKITQRVGSRGETYVDMLINIVQEKPQPREKVSAQALVTAVQVGMQEFIKMAGGTYDEKFFPPTN